LEWDSYDLDYSTSLKLQPERRLLSRKVVADGALEYRIRSCYAIGQSSTLTQDIIFYANSPRIDYHTLLDLRDKRMVLKAAFPLDIHATTVRNEIQFGYIDRPMTENDALDVVKFEVCNHKWSDISENRYGVALLNDCKYGISARDGVLALTLAQSGAHPDVTAGCGVCEFTYTLLPHDGAMHTENVTKPAYMLNMPPRVLPGALRRPLTPLLDVGCDHVICETIKPSEDVPGAVIARLYEAERTRGICHIRLPEGYTGAYVTNMLEEIEQPLTVKDGCITLPMRPFEIKTVMFTR
jgi:alpha-mannosidase